MRPGQNPQATWKAAQIESYLNAVDATIPASPQVPCAQESMVFSKFMQDL